MNYQEMTSVGAMLETDRVEDLTLPGRSPATKLAEQREPFLKRQVDAALSGLMLLVSAPVWLAIARAIQLGDGGPVFYYQERWGRGGRPFRVRKFRTMIADADQKYGILQAKKGDPRITRVGKILRAAGLDELPQLLSIWRGDMSFVGPRALAVGELVDDEHGNRIAYERVPGFYERLAVRPGLTGIATIFIPKDAKPRRKFRYDLFYIRHQSLSLDLYLIALSFWISFRGKWETRERKF